MCNNDALYLTDAQYERVLEKIGATVTQDDFEVVCSDQAIIGDKFTASNCGFCNVAYTDKDTALFPRLYPEYRTMKYRRENHRCPFDMREEPGILGWGWSCFDECYLFKHLHKRDWDLQVIRKMVYETTKEQLYAKQADPDRT